MKKRFLIAFVAALAFSMLIGIYYTSADAEKAKPYAGTTAKKAMPAEKAVKVETCYDCHSQIKDFHAGSKHAKVNCSNCHEGLDSHVKDTTTKPVTRTDHAVCGKCHKEQYESFVSVNLESKAKVEKATFKSRSPLFDKLMAPHGFTKEHAEPRSHVFMLVDHLIVDRGYGGRFQLKDWTKISDAKGSEKSAWGVLIDKDPSTSDQKAFIPQTATAANPRGDPSG